MLPLSPEILVSTATALAAWEQGPKALVAEQDRAIADGTTGDAGMRFVHFVGFWSHFAHVSHSSSWPLPPFERIAELADFAAQYRARWLTPRAGDVFLLASFRGDQHVSAGIIADVETMSAMSDGSLEFICTTIEGALGDPPRPMAKLVRRRLSPSLGDSFIRWRELSPAAQAVTIEHVPPKEEAA